MTGDEYLKGLVGCDAKDCIRWPLSFGTSGYGSVFVYGRGTMHASRRMCEHAHGVPDGYREAAHSCGNRWCVNPNHLSWKTKKGNALDRLSHGTHHRGERSPGAKLTEEAARAIRASREPVKTIAERFGISTHTVNHIRCGRRWAHLWTDPNLEDRSAA